MVPFIKSYFLFSLDLVLYVLSFSIPIISLQCSSTGVSPSDRNTELKIKIESGAIYGRVFDVSNNSNPDNKHRKIKLYGPNDLFEVYDSTGLYYFKNIPVGNYDLVVESSDKHRMIDSVRNIVVGRDSVSFIQTVMTNSANFIRQWNGKKLHERDMEIVGKIKGRYSADDFNKQAEGYGFSPESDLPIIFFNNKNVDYYSIENKGSFAYATATDSLGNFEINNVKPGLYAGYTSYGEHYFSLIISILVLPDSTAVVDFDHFMPDETILENYLLSKPYSTWDYKYN